MDGCQGSNCSRFGNVTSWRWVRESDVRRYLVYTCVHGKEWIVAFDLTHPMTDHPLTVTQITAPP
jgi:hypothetical protein